MCANCAGVSVSTTSAIAGSALLERRRRCAPRTSPAQRADLRRRGVGSSDLGLRRAPAARRSRAAACARCQREPVVERRRARAAPARRRSRRSRRATGTRARAPGCSRAAARCSRASSEGRRSSAAIIAAPATGRGMERRHGAERRDHGRGQGHPHAIGAAEGAAPPRPAAAYCSMCSTPLPRWGPTASSSITGHGADEVEAAVARARACAFVRQEPQLGTGHAVQQAVPLLDDDGTTLILNGDVPLIEAATARALVDACGGERLALLTVELADADRLRPHRARRRRRRRCDRAIVEHKDATADAARDPRDLHRHDGRADARAEALAGGACATTTRSGEYYLTDVVAMAVADGVPVVAAPAARARPRCSASTARRSSPTSSGRYQRRRADALMEAGVRLADPARFDLRGELRLRQRRRDRRRLHLRRPRRARRRRAHRRALRDPQRARSPPARRSARSPTSTARRSA